MYALTHRKIYADIPTFRSVHGIYCPSKTVFTVNLLLILNATNCFCTTIHAFTQYFETLSLSYLFHSVMTISLNYFVTLILHAFIKLLNLYIVWGCYDLNRFGAEMT